MRVQVPFGRRQLIGVVWNTEHSSDFKAERLKAISEVLDKEPVIDDAFCQFLEKSAQYYHHPLGEVVLGALPKALRDGKNLSVDLPQIAFCYQPAQYDLNDSQQQCLKQITSAHHTFAPFLLEGVTGSGKTELYIQATHHALTSQHQVLIMVPEIALTPQTLQRFSHRFGEGILHYHSKATPKERFMCWQQVAKGKPCVIIGTRSAVFLPFTQLGLIVVDEEHDLSFKQQEGFRYSGKDMAIMRAKMANCPVILGSATPSLESLHHAKQGKYQWLKLTERANTLAVPTPSILDIRRQKCIGGLSPALIKRIESTLATGKQVLLFLNRRGFSPAIICHSCGWLANCKHCDAKMTFHANINGLICHHCEYQLRLPKQCPDCQQEQIIPLGQGTERLEVELEQLFPEHPIARIDSDTTRKKGTLSKLLTQAKENAAPILVGTQMLAKGHHFPHLQLVALIDVDSGLFSSDFRATERMAQLLIQVAGRAGRGEHQGEVIIQTHNPEHPLFELIEKNDYTTVSAWLEQERASAELPPYSYLGLFRALAEDKHKAQKVLQQLSEKLGQFKEVLSLGPVPAPMFKRQGRFHYQLLLQSNHRKSLHQALSFATHFLESSHDARRVRWSCDVDPLEML